MAEGSGQLTAPRSPHPAPILLTPQEILNYINRKEFEPLLKVDQLNLEKEKHKVFLRFGEGRRHRDPPGTVEGGLPVRTEVWGVLMNGGG